MFLTGIESRKKLVVLSSAPFAWEEVFDPMYYLALKLVIVSVGDRKSVV